MASKLIATVSDLEKIAADDNADTPALQAWRREAFGEGNVVGFRRLRPDIASRGENVAVLADFGKLRRLIASDAGGNV